MRLSRRLRNQRVDTSVTLTHLAALWTLKRHGPLSPGELAGHERVQPPSMTRVVAALEGMGLGTRTAPPPGWGGRGAGAGALSPRGGGAFGRGRPPPRRGPPGSGAACPGGVAGR